MGANPTQAQAAVLFLVGFTFISVGLAQAFGVIWLILGAIALASVRRSLHPVQAVGDKRRLTPQER